MGSLDGDRYAVARTALTTIGVIECTVTEMGAVRTRRGGNPLGT